MQDVVFNEIGTRMDIYGDMSFGRDDSRYRILDSRADTCSAACTTSVKGHDLVATACAHRVTVRPAARTILLAVLILSEVLSSRHTAVAGPTTDEPVSSASRTTMILAPPLRETARGGPCWQADRPGTVDTAAMAPVVTEVLRAMRSAAARSGGLDAIEITIVGERDDCPARPELRDRLGAEIADYFVDWLAVNARTRILRRYLVQLLVDEIGTQPAAYFWDASSDSLRATIELIVRSEPHNGEFPIPAVSPDGNASQRRRFAIIVRAASPERPPTAALPILSAPPAPTVSAAPAAPHQQIEIQSELRSPRTGKRTAIGVRALVISALGTTHLGGQVSWTRSRQLGPVTARGGIRLGMLASDDEWANGGRLSRSSLGIVGLPVSIDRSVGQFRVHAGIVASSLLGLTAVRGEIEVGISGRLTPDLALGVAGGPAFTVASDDTHRSGWSSAVCIERSLP